MAIDVIMPKMGESITEGTILEWKKSVGDSIDLDETLLEISTDKVDSEVPSPGKGIITELNSSAIDEFLVIFLLAAKANGVSYFKGLSELDKKESPRLKWGSKILNSIGIKTITTKDSIKIYGNPNLHINKKIEIKNYLKDHRVFMTSVIAASTFGGKWIIFDKDSLSE